MLRIGVVLAMDIGARTLFVTSIATSARRWRLSVIRARWCKSD